MNANQKFNPFKRFKQSRNENFNTLKRIKSGSNAFTFTFEDNLLDEIRKLYINDILPFLQQPDHQFLFKGGQLHQQELGSHYLRTYDDKPLLWVSCNNDETFQIYLRFFKGLNIESDLRSLIDIQKFVRLYCGFLVIGNQASTPAFHMDYYPGANAYTLITPLFELQSTHGDLLYEDKRRKVKTYPYQINEAIILGDKFYHSTQPYPKHSTLRVLLSLTFGSDKMDYWHITKCTLENQSKYLILPCGHHIGSCDCILERFKNI